MGLAAGVFAGVLVVVLVNPRLGRDLEQATLHARSPGWLLLAVLAVVVFLLADGLTLGLLVRSHDPAVRLRSSLRVALESHLVSGATSFGGLEIPYQAVLLKRLGLSLPQITSALLLKALLHVSLLVLVAVAALLPVTQAPFTPTQRLIILGVLAGIAAVWSVGFFWLRRPWGLYRLPQPMSRRIAGFRDAAGVMRKAGWRVMLAVISLQLVYWAALLAVVPCLLHGLGWRPDLASIITRQAALHLLMPFSPLPGGAGVAELGYLELVARSLPGGIRIPSLVLWRVLTWVAPMVLGAFLLGLRGARGASGFPSSPPGKVVGMTESPHSRPGPGPCG